MLTPAVLRQEIEGMLTHPDVATKMASAALSLGKPEAAETLAGMVETLAQEGKQK